MTTEHVQSVSTRSVKYNNIVTELCHGGGVQLQLPFSELWDASQAAALAILLAILSAICCIHCIMKIVVYPADSADSIVESGERSVPKLTVLGRSLSSAEWSLLNILTAV